MESTLWTHCPQCGHEDWLLFLVSLCLARLAEMFQLDKVHTGSGRLEMDRLDSLNRCCN